MVSIDYCGNADDCTSTPYFIYSNAEIIYFSDFSDPTSWGVPVEETEEQNKAAHRLDMRSLVAEQRREISHEAPRPQLVCAPVWKPRNF